MDPSALVWHLPLPYLHAMGILPSDLDDPTVLLTKVRLAMDARHILWDLAVRTELPDFVAPLNFQAYKDLYLQYKTRARLKELAEPTPWPLSLLDAQRHGRTPITLLHLPAPTVTKHWLDTLLWGQVTEETNDHVTIQGTLSIPVDHGQKNPLLTRLLQRSASARLIFSSFAALYLVDKPVEWDDFLQRQRLAKRGREDEDEEGPPHQKIAEARLGGISFVRLPVVLGLSTKDDVVWPSLYWVKEELQGVLIDRPLWEQLFCPAASWDALHQRVDPALLPVMGIFSLEHQPGVGRLWRALDVIYTGPSKGDFVQGRRFQRVAFGTDVSLWKVIPHDGSSPISGYFQIGLVEPSM